MPALYAPAVKAAMQQMATQISTIAAANGLTVPEVTYGDKAQGLSLLRGGIYVRTPDDPNPGFNLNFQRQARLQFPVDCIWRDFVDQTSTLALVDLVGAVVDGIGSDSTLGGKCNNARPGPVLVRTVREQGSEDQLTYVATVTVDCDLFVQLL